MKKFFKNLGIAGLYFLLYLGIQIIVSFIFSIVILMIKMFSKMSDIKVMDSDLIVQQAMDEILQYAMLMVGISGLVFLLALWIIFLVRKKKFFKEVSINKFELSWLLPIIIFGASLNVFISGVMAFIPLPKGWVDAYVESYNSTESGNTIIAIVVTVLMAPIVEEIIFRGLIYTRLKSGMPIMAAAILSSLIFGLMHGNLIWGSYAFVLGMLLVWVFEKFKSLAANILVHFAFNVVGVLMGFVTEIPDALGLIILGICTCLLVFSVAWIKKISRKGEYIVKVIKC